MNSKFRVAAFAFGLVAALPTLAVVDVYDIANLTVGVSGGNANQQAPFVGIAPYPAGGAFTGSLVFDGAWSRARAQGLKAYFSQASLKLPGFRPRRLLICRWARCQPLRSPMP